MNKTKEVLTRKRIEIAEIKSKAGKLGEETKAVIPKNLEAMFAGKSCINLIKARVSSENCMWSYAVKYLNVPQDKATLWRGEAGGLKKMREYLKQHDNLIAFESMVEIQHECDLAFDRFKRKVTQIVSEHPLWLKFAVVKGFTAYQLALVMALVKDVGSFDTPSKLMVYAGQASIEGLAVTKANINKIKEIYAKQGKEFAGFNTILSGRMRVITDCLIRSKGYFYDMYSKIRVRLSEKAINEDRVEPMGKEGKLYMKGKNKQSLIMFTDRGAKRRIARILLHLIWTEWRKLEGLEIRNPYPISMLGHKSLITLEDVVKYEEANK